MEPSTERTKVATHATKSGTVVFGSFNSEIASFEVFNVSAIWLESLTVSTHSPKTTDGSELNQESSKACLQLVGNAFWMKLWAAIIVLAARSTLRRGMTSPLSVGVSLSIGTMAPPARTYASPFDVSGKNAAMASENRSTATTVANSTTVLPCGQTLSMAPTNRLSASSPHAPCMTEVSAVWVPVSLQGSST